ncbi:hypothetical protein B0H14DRAFT_3454122 [Mycena olivaceomarginata]|nr:hypothetical protein B0H14DRAFT_3454122 [Mycena olivaceomarginata]
MQHRPQCLPASRPRHRLPKALQREPIWVPASFPVIFPTLSLLFPPFLPAPSPTTPAPASAPTSPGATPHPCPSNHAQYPTPPHPNAPVVQNLDDVRGVEDAQAAGEVVPPWPHHRASEPAPAPLTVQVLVSHLPRRCDDAVDCYHDHRVRRELLCRRGGVVQQV